MLRNFMVNYVTSCHITKIITNPTQNHFILKDKEYNNYPYVMKWASYLTIAALNILNCHLW